MKRKQWINLGKILIGIGLIVFVLTKVQMQDLVMKDEKDTDPVAIPVRFESDWNDKNEVVARVLDTNEVLRFKPGGQAVGANGDGPKYSARPGMLRLVKDMDGWWLMGAVVLYFLACSSSAFRWQWLVRVNGLPLSLWQAFRLTWIGVFFNNVVPGLTGGDLVKAIYVVRHTGEKTRSIVSVIVDRIMGLTALGLLAAIVVPFQWERIRHDPGFMKLALAIYGTLLACCLLTALFFSKRIRRGIRLDEILKRLPFADLLRKVDEAFHFYRGHYAGLFGWFVFSVFNHALSVLGVYCVGEALGIGVPFVEYLVLIPVANIVSAVPISPSGWGVGEAIFGYLFAHFCTGYLPGVADAAAVMATRGVTLSIVYRLLLVLWSLLGGVFVAFSKERVAVTEDDINQLGS